MWGERGGHLLSIGGGERRQRGAGEEREVRDAQRHRMVKRVEPTCSSFLLPPPFHSLVQHTIAPTHTPAPPPPPTPPPPISSPSPSSFYDPKDLLIGGTVDIFSRKMRIVSCDPFTRSYYNKFQPSVVMPPDEPLPPKPKPRGKPAAPPSTGYVERRERMYTVHCTLHTVHCTLYTVHCTLYTVHCTLYTVHCTLCGVLRVVWWCCMWVCGYGG